MPHYPFHKYQGTGNDFILFDGRDGKTEVPGGHEAAELCDRHFGIGGDGLILLLPHESTDMEMRFFNPDGSESFCGNGSRCAIKAFFELGENTENRGIVRFKAVDGVHDGKLFDDGNVEVSIGTVNGVEERSEHAFVDTGSPHVIIPTHRPDHEDLRNIGLRTNELPQYRPGGTNVNLVQVLEKGHVRMRTFERGVEDETLSCGSGVTAAALWAASIGEAEKRCSVTTRGGDLMVRFEQLGNAFRDIRLIGPAERTFYGWTL